MLHFLFRKNLPAGCTIALHILVIVLSLLLPSLRHRLAYCICKCSPSIRRRANTLFPFWKPFQNWLSQACYCKMPHFWLEKKNPLRKFQKVLIYLNPNSDTLSARGETRVFWDCIPIRAGLFQHRQDAVPIKGDHVFPKGFLWWPHQVARGILDQTSGGTHAPWNSPIWSSESLTTGPPRKSIPRTFWSSPFMNDWAMRFSKGCFQIGKKKACCLQEEFLKTHRTVVIHKRKTVPPEL